MTRRLAAGSLGGIAVCLALSGCGSQSAVPKPAALPSDKIAAALDAAAEAVHGRGSADVAYTIAVNGGGLAKTISATGGIDFVRKDGMIDETVPGLATPIHGVFNSKTIAFELPASVRSAAHLTKPWIGLALTSVGSGFGTNDPTQSLGLLKGAAGVKDVGTGTINGIPCTHVVATVDFTKALGKLAPDLRSLVSQAKFPATVPEDVWLDADSLPRRITTTLAFTVDGQKVSERLTYDLSDFGTPVTVDFPAAGQIQQESSFTNFVQSLASAGAAAASASTAASG